MTPELQTARLLLKPLAIEDADQIQKVFPRWEIVKYLNAFVPWPYPPDGAEHFLRKIALPEMASGVSWIWSIRPKRAAEQLIGVISLTTKPAGNRGFWIDPAWQGQGLMTEASDAVTDYWFEVLHQPALSVPKAIARGFAADLGEARDADRFARRKGLRRGPLAIGDVGNYGGGMATTEAGAGEFSGGFVLTS
jgi:GNAT superfamily N-acetyltransferase